MDYLRYIPLFVQLSKSPAKTKTNPLPCLDVAGRHKVFGRLFSEQVTKMDKGEAKLWEKPTVDPVCRYSR